MKMENRHFEAICYAYNRLPEKQDILFEIPDIIRSFVAEIERLRNINTELCKSFNTINIHGAHIEDSLRREIMELKKQLEFKPTLYSSNPDHGD